MLADAPDDRLRGLLVHVCGDEKSLRETKSDLHLLTALCDLGGVWDLEHVTGALSAFADEAVRAAFAIAWREAVASGKAAEPAEGETSMPGIFCIAMGKHGAGELNYSSDIDISIFFDPATLPVIKSMEAQAFATRFADRVAEILQRRTVDGYVFRVDLRLRPDPSSTPSAVSLPAAYHYYETVGQNWERAAFIKARVVAGDFDLGLRFLSDLQPFIWRRNLDFAAIADIHAIKRQIHTHKTDDRLTAAGADLKLGRGGIREIEFFVQTQQLILGGREPRLRTRGTLETVAMLASLGHVTAGDAKVLDAAYRRLRALEHRAQMIADDQTHRLPENKQARRAIAALSGQASLTTFDAEVGRTLRSVNAIYGALFAGEETLSSKYGSLIFTGVEDDPETLSTLTRMGFTDGARVSATIRRWHHGRAPATRSERGRELLTRLGPRLLDAVAATGSPDVAFARFEDFFSHLKAGVQLQSLLLAQPKLLELLVSVMAFAPSFARTLSRRPAALDAMLDPDFYTPGAAPDMAALAGLEFEAAMDEARRLHAEAAFRVGVRVLGGAADGLAAGVAFADLADGIIRALAGASLTEVQRVAGAFPGDVAVIALGKCGSREMSARSDLDLMTLYRPHTAGAASALKGWGAETFYARFTQRLVAALSAPTREGDLYEVDLQLRPSGTKGPVAVSAAAFQRYYERECETWELLALTRARVVWATSDAFAYSAAELIENALRRPRDRTATANDVLTMRDLMTEERPPSGYWDMKLIRGGLVDIEFCSQFLQLVSASAGGPLRQNTGEALEALTVSQDGGSEDLDKLRGSWSLHQSVSQLLKIALEDGTDPALEPPAFQALLARMGGARTFPGLIKSLDRARRETRDIYDRLLGSADKALA